MRPGPPRGSAIVRPGALGLAQGEERYTAPGGGAITVSIRSGDRVRIVDVEGMQRCELVAADKFGSIDPGILAARGDGQASGLKQVLSGDSESAQMVRAGLARRGIDLARARSINLFGADSAPGSSAEFIAARDGILIVAAPGAAMDVAAQDTPTPILSLIHI